MISQQHSTQFFPLESTTGLNNYPFDFMLFGDDHHAGEDFGDYLQMDSRCVGTAESVVTHPNLGEAITASKRKIGLVKKPKVEEEEEEEERMKRNRDSEDGRDSNKQREVWKEGKEKKEKGDFIHVRARRGQATDSHSLAERVRRERISERMRHLQDLVPGCNKITGKAGMLDEIISYVQSLQRQVEFLSMKLAAMDATPNFVGESCCFREEEMGRLEMGGNPVYPPHCSMAQLLELEMGEEVDIQGGIHTVSHLVNSPPQISWLPPPPPLFPLTPDSGEGMWMERGGEQEIMRWGR